MISLALAREGCFTLALNDLPQEALEIAIQMHNQQVQESQKKP